MQFIDTHTHLYLNEFDNDRKQVIEKCLKNGITKLLLPNVDVKTIQPMLNLVWDFPENCFPMMGLHPCSVTRDAEIQLFEIYKWFKKRKFYAVGEIGLDYYWSTEFKSEQIQVFKKQVQWAIQLNLPVVIHSRNSIDDCIFILEQMKHPQLKGVFHCFSGNALQASKIVSLGFYLGIGGVLTYKNSGLAQAIENIELDYMILETDSPYLAPVPYRGKRNESFYLIEIAKKLAEIKGCSLQQVANKTTANAINLFGI